MTKHILYLVANDGYFISHRLHLAKADLKQGYRVTLVTSLGSHIFEIQKHGIQVFPINFKRGSINLLSALKIIWQIFKIYKNQKPDIVHHVALKPAIFGTIAAYMAGIPKVINAIAGMGYIFTESNYKTKVLQFVVKSLFKLLLNRKNQSIIVQNHDDKDFFKNFLTKAKVKLMPGAGVNIDRFYPQPEPPAPPYVVTLVARMLWTKGIKEFVEVAKILKDLYKQGRIPSIIFQLVGSPDPENLASIPDHILQQWHQSGIITYLGNQNDIPSIYHKSHIAVLPSYREGLPKSLLEAASCGKPIITCDVPGCRMIVRDNGLLIPSHNAQALAGAIQQLIEDEDMRQQMGKNSRKFILDNFTETHIQEQTLKLY